MKLIVNLVLGLFAAVAVICVMEGCTTSQQTAGYQTLYGLESGATAAYSGYTSLVIKGTVPTNNVPAISKAFNIFQASMLPALDAVQYSTNALAPANLIQESTDLIHLINTAEGK